jgi:hypothetical protein
MGQFSDEPIEPDFVPIPPMVDALIASAKKRGPMVLEAWDCPRCKRESFCFHHFSETLSCGFCDHPVASAVPRYLTVCEAAVDSK